MINKREILIDRIKGPVAISFSIALIFFFKNSYDWSDFFITISIFLILLVGFSLIMAENYLVGFEENNRIISFDYKITLSDSLHKQKIDLGAIKKIKFHSKSNFINDFHSITIKYNQGNNLESFNIKIKDDKTWITILAQLKKSMHHNGNRCTTP